MALAAWRGCREKVDGGLVGFACVERMQSEGGGRPGGFGSMSKTLSKTSSNFILFFYKKKSKQPIPLKNSCPNLSC